MSDRKSEAKAFVGLVSFPVWLSTFLLFSFMGGCWDGGCRMGYERTGAHLGVLVKAAKDVIVP